MDYGDSALNSLPAGRLAQVVGSPIADRTFVYDGLEAIAEHGSGGALQGRYVFGPGIDEPLVAYDSAGARRFLHADERGSIVAHSDAAGNLATINAYDEFGVPAAANSGRFGYTGQMWLHEIGLYHYKARAYAPQLGRFLQPDPIGYADSPNLYSYALDDPVNLADPFGACVGGRLCEKEINKNTDALKNALTLMGFNGTGMSLQGLLGYAEGIIGFYDTLSQALFDTYMSDPASQARGSGSVTPGQGYSQTLSEIARDPDVRAKIVSAWVLSNPYGSANTKNEHGFWISDRGRANYISHEMLYGRGAQILGVLDRRPLGAEIFFHTHPFSTAEGYRIGFSGDDFNVIRSAQILMIIMTNTGPSQAGLMEYDFRPSLYR